MTTNGHQTNGANGNEAGDNGRLFAPTSEADVTRAIASEWFDTFEDHIESDVIVVGGGPAGLMAARDLADEGKDVLVIERNNYLGGGHWLGGFLFNPLTVRAPAQEIWDEIDVSYREVEDQDGLYITEGPQAASGLIKAASDAGATFQNVTEVNDLVVREGGKVEGVVMNWTPVDALPRAITCVDPIAIEADVVIDATGHGAEAVTKLHERGYLDVPGYQDLGITSEADREEKQRTHAGHDNVAHGSMWADKSEDLVVEKTGVVHPGLVVAGMATATTFDLPRMGPTFGAMLLSGRKAAEVALEELENPTTAEDLAEARAAPEA